MAEIKNATNAYVKDDNGDLIQIYGKQYLNFTSSTMGKITFNSTLKKTSKDTAIINVKFTYLGNYTTNSISLIMPYEINNFQIESAIDNTGNRIPCSIDISTSDWNPHPIYINLNSFKPTYGTPATVIATIKLKNIIFKNLN